MSLNQVLNEIYSSILNNKLTIITQYLEENKILVDEQNGFRKFRSCEDHIFVLSSIINGRKVEGKSTFVAFVDMSKDFDSINHNMLYYKAAYK